MRMQLFGWCLISVGQKEVQPLLFFITFKIIMSLAMEIENRAIEGVFF